MKATMLRQNRPRMKTGWHLTTLKTWQCRSLLRQKCDNVWRGSVKRIWRGSNERANCDIMVITLSNNKQLFTQDWSISLLPLFIMVYQQCVGDKICQECLGQLMAGRQGLVIGWCNILVSCWPGDRVLARSGHTDMMQLWIIRESSWVTIPLILLLFIVHTVFGTEEHIYPTWTSVRHTIIRDSSAFCCWRAISSTKDHNVP